MDSAEFTFLQQVLFAVLGPIFGWMLAFIVAATIGGAFLELYFEFDNWLQEQAGT